MRAAPCTSRNALRRAGPPPVPAAGTRQARRGTIAVPASTVLKVNTAAHDQRTSSDLPRVVTAVRRSILRLGVKNSVIAVTIPMIALSAAMTTLLQALLGSPLTATSVLIAAIVPACLAPPVTWLLIDLIVRLDRSERIQRYLATHDPLTDLYNRREFFKRALRMHERSRRSGAGGSLMMVNVDHLKPINDEWGHQAGDRALRHVADLCRAETRAGDVLARYGGGEIAILISGIEAPVAQAIAGRLRDRIAGTPLSLGNGRRLTVTVNIGVAPLDPVNETLERTLARADQALRDDQQADHEWIGVNPAGPALRTA